MKPLPALSTWFRFARPVGLACLLGASFSLAAQVPAAPVSDQAFEASARQERERLQQAHERAKADFRAEHLACRQQFFVNDCTKAVSARERETLAVLRRQEQVLELAERQRRLDMALARSAQRQAQHQSLAPLESEEQAAARQREAEQALAKERERREAEAAGRAARQQARALDAERQQQAKDAAERTRAAPLLSPPPTR